MTGRERLEFAISFSRMNLAKLRRGDRLNLLDDLQAFFGVRPGGEETTLADLGGVIPTVSPKAVRALKPDDLRELQHVARDLLAITTGASDTWRPRKLDGKTVRKNQARLSLMKRFGAPTITVFGQPEDVFEIMLMLLLTNAPAFGLRVLSCPECGSPFVRVRRQKYCSTKCTWGANKRNQRSKPTAKKKKGKRHGKKRRRTPKTR